MDHDEVLDVFSEDALHAMLHDGRGSAELSLHDPRLQLETNEDLQSDTESTPSHAAARQEAREEQQMGTPDPAHQQESRQERQRRLNRASQAKHRRKRTGERKVMQGQIFELQKQLQSALALNSRLRSRNALLERSTFLCAGTPHMEELRGPWVSVNARLAGMLGTRVPHKLVLPLGGKRQELHTSRACSLPFQEACLLWKCFVNDWSEVMAEARPGPDDALRLQEGITTFSQWLTGLAFGNPTLLQQLLEQPLDAAGQAAPVQAVPDAHMYETLLGCLNLTQEQQEALVRRRNILRRTQGPLIRRRLALTAELHRLSAQAMQPSRAFFKPPQPPPLLVEEVATPGGAELALGVQTALGSAQPGDQRPAWSLIRSRTRDEGAGQHGSVSSQPAQASPAGPAQADLSRAFQTGRASPSRSAQPGRPATGWADLPGRQEEFTDQAMASAQPSAGMAGGCRSMQQSLSFAAQAARSQPGLIPAGRPARQGDEAVLPPAKVTKPTEPAGRPMGQTTTFDAAWPPQVLLPSSSNAASQPGATVSAPAQQAAAGAEAALSSTYSFDSNTSQAMPGLSPPLPTSTESLLRQPQSAAFQSAQPNRSIFDHIMQSESNNPRSTPQLQPHSYHQPGPRHGAAALQQQQTLPAKRHELPPTQPLGSAAAAKAQQHQTAHARTAEQQQTGLWGGQQPPSGQDLDVQAPAHGKARPLQPLGVVQELQQVLLEVGPTGIDDVQMPTENCVSRRDSKCPGLTWAALAASYGAYSSWPEVCIALELLFERHWCCTEGRRGVARIH